MIAVDRHESRYSACGATENSTVRGSITRTPASPPS